jgi:hypothetical protein
VTILEERSATSSPALSFDSVRTDPSESAIDGALEEPEIPDAPDVPDNMEVPATEVEPEPEPEYIAETIEIPAVPTLNTWGFNVSSKKKGKKNRKTYSPLEAPEPEPTPEEPKFGF